MGAVCHCDVAALSIVLRLSSVCCASCAPSLRCLLWIAAHCNRGRSREIEVAELGSVISPSPLLCYKVIGSFSLSPLFWQETVTSYRNYHQCFACCVRVESDSQRSITRRSILYLLPCLPPSSESRALRELWGESLSTNSAALANSGSLTRYM